jgi:hypothetical protein
VDKPAAERAVLTLEDMGGTAVPFAVRLRAALKRCRRNFALRAVRIDPADVPPIPAAAAPTEREEMAP